MGDSSTKGTGMSRLKPPKIIALKKRTPGPSPAPDPPTALPVKKSCLKPGSSSSGSSTASSSSANSPGGVPTTGGGGGKGIPPPRPSKSVQIKTSHNLVKLVPHTKLARQSSGGSSYSITSTFRELFRDFPANATGSVSVMGGGVVTAGKVNAKPPPYRNPPPPTTTQGSSTLKRPVKKTEGAFDEIEIDTGQGTLTKKQQQQQMKDNLKKTSLTGTLPRKAPPNNYVIFKEIRTKAEVTATQDGQRTGTDFVSDRFQNLPVKPRKSAGMQRLENYCLFDPSVDFISEKEELSEDSVPPGMRNYDVVVEPGPSSFVDTDLYILDSLTDAMYGQSIGVSGLERGTPSLPSTRSSSGVSTPVGLAAAGGSAVVVGCTDRYIQVIINHRKLF